MSAVAELIDVDALIPDGIEPIEQYRVWNWDGKHLCSLNHHRWIPGEPLKASCSTAAKQYEYVLVKGAGFGLTTWREREEERKAQETQWRAQSNSYWYGAPTYIPPVPSVEPPSGYGYELRPVAHDAPHENCSCGIYAAATEDHEYRDQGRVWGKVKMWGKIVPGTKGARAEYAYPSELHVPEELANDPAILAYGVPVIVEESSAAGDFVAAVRRRDASWWMRFAAALNFTFAALNLSLVGLHVFH